MLQLSDAEQIHAVFTLCIIELHDPALSYFFVDTIGRSTVSEYFKCLCPCKICHCWLQLFCHDRLKFLQVTIIPVRIIVTKIDRACIVGIKRALSTC